MTRKSKKVEAFDRMDVEYLLRDAIRVGLTVDKVPERVDTFLRARRDFEKGNFATERKSPFAAECHEDDLS